MGVKKTFKKMSDAQRMSLMGVIGMLLIMITSYIYYETNWQSNIDIALFGGAMNMLSLAWFLGLILVSFRKMED